MDRLIDSSISRMLEMGIKEAEGYEPKTIAEALAKKLISEAMKEEGIKAIQIIADRTSGKAAQVKEDNKSDVDYAEGLREMLGGKKGE